MRRSVKTLLLMVGMTMAAPATAENWVRYVENDSGTVFFYDSEGLRTVGSLIMVWQRQDYSRNRSIEAREALGYILLMIVKIERRPFFM